MIPRTLIICFSLLTFISMRCSELSVSGNGGSSETINAKVIITDTVAILTADSRDSSGLVMEVFSTNYRPYEKVGFTAKIEKGKTAGSVSLPSNGVYNFLIYSEERKLSCFIQEKVIQPGRNDTTCCVLSSECVVDGRLVPAMDGKIDKEYAVSVQGSPFLCVTDKTESFSLGSMPRGNFILTVRPKEQRLFISNAHYEFKVDEITDRTRLEVVLP